MTPSFALRQRIALAAAVFALGSPSLLQAQGVTETKTTKTTTRTTTKATTALPAARQLVDRHIKAIGGKDALLKYTSRTIKGALELPAQGMRADVVIFAASPNKALQKMTIPGMGEIVQGYDGTVGWAIDPTQGPMLLEGKMLEQMKRQSDFRQEMHDPKEFKSMETLEITDFEGAKAYKVKLIRATGEELFEYFNTESGLMVGQTATVESAMGPVSTTSVHSDFKNFSGILVPTRMVTRIQGQEMIMTVTSVEMDTVQPSVFDLPEQIKALVSK